MNNYTRPSIYQTNYTLEIFDGEGSIYHISNDHDRFSELGCIGKSKNIEFLQAVDDGISQLYYQLKRFRVHVRDRIAKEVISAANKEATA